MGSSIVADGGLRSAAIVGATVLVLAGLWAASAVMIPVAFALFIIALVWLLRSAATLRRSRGFWRRRRKPQSQLARDKRAVGSPL